MADADKLNTDGREKNAAQPLNEADDGGGPERYPPVRQDDSVQAGEGRSFNPGGAPPSRQEGDLGPAGDPAEGKR